MVFHIDNDTQVVSFSLYLITKLFLSHLLHSMHAVYIISILYM